MRSSRRVALVLLAAYVLFVLWVLLRQSPELGTQVSYRLWQVAVWLGAAPTWENFVWAEFVANVGMLVPLILLCTIIWPRPSWRDWTAGVFLFSLGVEFIQAALLAERSASYSDVVANTLGGWGRFWGWGLGTSSPGGSVGSTNLEVGSTNLEVGSTTGVARPPRVTGPRHVLAWRLGRLDQL